MYNEFTQKDYESLKRFVYKNLSEELSMLDLIMDYITEHNFFMNDVADFIKRDTEFKNLFEKNLQKNKQIYYIKDGKIKYPSKKASIW